MADIKITFKDGTTREFKHEGRPGGSYTKVLSLEPGFIVVTDEWGQKNIFPSDTVKEVEQSHERCW